MNRPLCDKKGRVVAVARLRMLIELAADVRPGLVPAAEAPTTGRRIFVGYGSHLQSVVSPPEAPEGLKIIECDGDVYLLGEIASAGTNNWPGAIDRGVMHAAETLAERLAGTSGSAPAGPRPSTATTATTSKPGRRGTLKSIPSYSAACSRDVHAQFDTRV